MRIWVLLSTCVLCFLPEVGCQSGDQAKALKRKLLVTDGYDYMIRPIIDQSQILYVRVDFCILALNEVDEASETVQTTGYLNLNWQDQYLVWNVSDYGNIQYVLYPQSVVWTPDIALYNSYLDYKNIGDPALNVRIRYDGYLRWQPFQVFQSTCSIDITYFPFDVQTCSLTFVAWSYRKGEVKVVGGREGIKLTDYQESSQWDITETTWYNAENVDTSSITFELKLRRKPLYNVLTIVFPVMLLAFLNLLVFTIPCASGEKSGYAITVFLAFAVFLTIIESSFPKNSDTVSYFAIYVIVQTAQSTLVTFIALIMIKCSHFDEKTKVARAVVFLAKLGKFKYGLKCKGCATNQSQTGVNTVTPFGLKAVNEKGQNETIVEHENPVIKHDDNNTSDDDMDKKYTWDWAMNGLDNLFLMLFSCLLVSVTLGCLLVSYTSG